MSQAAKSSALSRTEIIARGVGLTVCPISNTYVVRNSRSDDIKRMLDHGMLASVGSDDPAYFLGYMNENLKVVQRDGNLDIAHVVQLMQNAFSTSWASDAAKTGYLAQLDACVEAFTR